MMIGAATVMPTQIIADLKLVIHVVTEMMVEMPVVMFSQAMKVKTIITVTLVVHQ